jgi:hypothetical protein
MIFAEGTEVIYKGKCGVIDFVCETYVVVEVLSVPDRNPARLVVFRHDYKQLEISKASTK